MKRRITLMWRRLAANETGKDVFLVPACLASRMGMDLDIVCSLQDQSTKIPEEFGGARIRHVERPMAHRPALRIPVNICYLLLHSRSTDVLVLFHWRLETILNILLYKTLNPKGRVYVKLDSANGQELMKERPLFRKALEKTDVVSCELSEVFRRLESESPLSSLLENRLVLVPNGFDEDSLKALVKEDPAFADMGKEKIILAAGRAGTHQKNLEMLLNATRGLNLNGWRVILAGSTTDAFRKAAEGSGVELAGEICDRKQLWSLFARASVFVCTSRWESYGIVLREAQRFGCHIVSTDAGAARDIMEQSGGTLIPQDDSAALRNILEAIVAERHDIRVNRIPPEEISYGRMVETIAEKLK